MVSNKEMDVVDAVGDVLNNTPMFDGLDIA